MAMIAGTYGARDENVQVNGYVFVVDMTGVAMKHMTRWTMDELRTWTHCWQVSLSTTNVSSRHVFGGGEGIPPPIPKIANSPGNF